MVTPTPLGSSADKEMNFNSANMENICLLKACCEVEDGSSLKLASHREMRLHTLEDEVQVTTKEDGEL